MAARPSSGASRIPEDRQNGQSISSLGSGAFKHPQTFSVLETLDPKLATAISSRIAESRENALSTGSARLFLLAPMLSNPAAQKELISRLLGDDRTAAYEALQLLSAVCNPETADLLAAYAPQETHPRTLRLRAVLALKEHAGREDIAHAISQIALKDPSPEAIEALVPADGIVPKVTVQTLRELALSHPNYATRERARRQVCLLHEDVAPELVREQLEAYCSPYALAERAPRFTRVWSKAIVGNVVKVIASLDDTKSDQYKRLEEALNRQARVFPQATTTSILSLVDSFSEAVRMPVKMHERVFSTLKLIFSQPAQTTNIDPVTAQKTFDVAHSQLSQGRRGGEGNRLDLLTVNLFRNNYLPEEICRTRALSLMPLLQPLAKVQLLAAALNKPWVSEGHDLARLVKCAASLPGTSNLFTLLLEHARGTGPKVTFHQAVEDIFSHTKQNQALWSTKEEWQIQVVELIKALSMYHGRDMDAVERSVNGSLKQLQAESAAEQMWSLLTTSPLDALLNWKTFPLVPSPSLSEKHFIAISAYEAVNGALLLCSRLQSVSSDVQTKRSAEALTKKLEELQKLLSKTTQDLAPLYKEIEQLPEPIQRTLRSSLFLKEVDVLGELEKLSLTGADRKKLLKSFEEIQAKEQVTHAAMVRCFTELEIVIKRFAAAPQSSMDSETRDLGHNGNQFLKKPLGLLTKLCAIGIAASRGDADTMQNLAIEIVDDQPYHVESLSNLFVSLALQGREEGKAALISLGEHVVASAAQNRLNLTDFETLTCRLIESKAQISQSLESLLFACAGLLSDRQEAEQFLHPEFARWIMSKPLSDDHRQGHALTGFQECTILKVAEELLTTREGSKAEALLTVLRYWAIQTRIPPYEAYLREISFQRSLIAIVKGNFKLDIRELAAFALSQYGAPEYEGAELDPSLLQEIYSGILTGDDLTRIFCLRALPICHVERLFVMAADKKAPEHARAKRELKLLASVLERGDSRDVRLEAIHKLFSVLVTCNEGCRDICTSVLRALGTMPADDYLMGQLEPERVALSNLYSWSAHPPRPETLTDDKGEVPAAIKSSYGLLEFLFKQKRSRNKSTAQGARLLLGMIFD